MVGVASWCLYIERVLIFTVDTSFIFLFQFVYPLHCLCLVAQLTSSENGDHDNLNQDPPPSSAAQSNFPHSMGRGGSDHPCNPSEKGQTSYAKATKFGLGCIAHSSNPYPEERIDSPWSPSVPLPAHVIGDTSPTEPRVNEPLLFGSRPTPPIEHMEELIALCLLGKFWGESTPLPAIINKTRNDWKFIRGHVSYVDLGNN